MFEVFHGIFCLPLITKRCAGDKVGVTTTPEMNTTPSGITIQELVTEMRSDLFRTGKLVTGDQLYSVINTIEMLYEKGLSAPH